MYKIRYTNKYTGRPATHEYSGSRHGAEGWARALSESNNGCRSEVVREEGGRTEHIITVGNDSK